MDDDFDHEDAWGDVKKAKQNIGQYEKSITEGIKYKEEKQLGDYLQDNDVYGNQPNR